MTAMRDAVAARPDEAWGSTVYDAWLAAIEPMWLPHGTAFPDFMQGDAWTAKDQQTGFGSYAELKHDTILYTKQAVGEMGGGGPDKTPRSWVEPDPVPFARLQAMADLERQGLSSRGLLNKPLDKLLTDYSDLAGFLARIATDELAGRSISKADNSRLLYIGGELEDLWWRTSDVPNGGQPPHPGRSVCHRRGHRERARPGNGHDHGGRDRDGLCRPAAGARPGRQGPLPRRAGRGLFVLRVPPAGQRPTHG